MELADGSCLGIEASRTALERLMRPAVEPQRVYAHSWEAGDVVLADNWAVWHSATGGLDRDSRRVMHLSAWDGSRSPGA